MLFLFFVFVFLDGTYYCIARENVVGWYSTGPKVRASDLEINELMRKYTPNPVLVIIDPTDTTTLGLPTKAYISVEEVSEVRIIVSTEKQTKQNEKNKQIDERWRVESAAYVSTHCIGDGCVGGRRGRRRASAARHSAAERRNVGGRRGGASDGAAIARPATRHAAALRRRRACGQAATVATHRRPAAGCVQSRSCRLAAAAVDCLCHRFECSFSRVFIIMPFLTLSHSLFLEYAINYVCVGVDAIDCRIAQSSA